MCRVRLGTVIIKIEVNQRFYEKENVFMYFAYSNIIHNMSRITCQRLETRNHFEKAPSNVLQLHVSSRSRSREEKFRDNSRYEKGKKAPKGA